MPFKADPFLLEPAFTAPPAQLVLGPLHVWRLVAADLSLLSDAERDHAKKIRSEPARAAFIAGRSGVRRVASRYSKIPPGELVWETAADGKPYFANVGIHFNLSHTGGTVVAAFSGSAVGIDIEPRGRCRDFAGIANRFFHPAEAAAIKDEEQFLRIWTGKEAMLKLSGEGISGGLADARPGDAGTGNLRGNPVHITGFSFENIVGAVASFEPVEVKGWFQL
ncbi:MAG: 4'-phosphopantetheinyl transferase superfamily protein [Verrucomicrobiota bacterium]